MPRQELFFEYRAGDWRVEVVNTYDSAYAGDAFEAMDDAARGHLSTALRTDVDHDAEDSEHGEIRWRTADPWP